MYPRCIIIFKSYIKNSYDIKSFEIYLNSTNKEEYKELYSVENVKNQEDLTKELREIIYGKNLLRDALKIYEHNFFK